MLILYKVHKKTSYIVILHTLEKDETMDILKEKWEETLRLLSPDLTEVSYRTWFEPIIPLKIDQDSKKIYLKLMNEMNLSILKSRYFTLLSNAVAVAFKDDYEIVLTLDDIDEEEDYHESELSEEIKSEE